MGALERSPLTLLPNEALSSFQTNRKSQELLLISADKSIKEILSRLFWAVDVFSACPPWTRITSVNCSGGSRLLIRKTLFAEAL